MKDELPAHFRLAYAPDLIRNRVQQMARTITEWAQGVAAGTGEQVLGVCILRGGVFFFGDLLRSMTTSIEPAFIRTFSYSSDANAKTPGAVRVSMSDVIAQNRSILMVDDICDTGATLLKLQNVFSDLGAREVRSAVLIHRQVEDSLFRPTWSAFEYQGSEWFVGYGMEDRNHYANLAGVYTIVNER